MVSRVPDMPTIHLDTLDIAITAKCNLSCAHCYQGYIKNTFEIPTHRVISMLDEGLNVGLEHVVLTGGEPLVHPGIQEILGAAKDRILFVTLMTNGTLIQTMDWIIDYVDEAIVSLDGFQNIHDKIRGRGNWKRTIDGIKTLVDAGIPVIVNTQITKDTLSKIDKYLEFLNSLGVHQLNRSDI